MSESMNREMAFCPECNNMLCPREDRDRFQLMYVCRRCDFQVYANRTNPEENCVDRLAFSYKSKEDLFINSDLAKDPTLAIKMDWKCSRCRSKGAVLYQLPERIAEDAMTMVNVCLKTNCGYWERQRDDDDDDDSDANDERIDLAQNYIKKMQKKENLSNEYHTNEGKIQMKHEIIEEGKHHHYDNVINEDDDNKSYDDSIANTNALNDVGDSSLFGEDENPALADDFESHRNDDCY